MKNVERKNQGASVSNASIPSSSSGPAAPLPAFLPPAGRSPKTETTPSIKAKTEEITIWSAGYYATVRKMMRAKELIDYARYSKQRDQAVDLLLAGGFHLPPVVLEQFAQIHVPFDVVNTKYEGVNALESINFWIGTLRFFKTSDWKIIHTEVTAKQLDQLVEAFEFYKKIYLIIHNDERGSVAKNLQLLVKEQLETVGYLYIPFGYTQTRWNEGHAIPCRFEKEGQFIVAHMLNKGEGSHRHPLIDFTSSQVKPSMRSLPIYIQQDDLYGPLGLSFFEYMIDLRLNPLQVGDTGYNTGDLFEAFYLLGKFDFRLKDPALWAGKSQSGNSCGEKATKNVVHDMLICLGSERVQNRRFFLNVALWSLIAAHQESINSPILEKAIASVGVQAQKYFEKTLSQEEFLLVEALLQNLNHHYHLRLSLEIKVEPFSFDFINPKQLSFHFLKEKRARLLLEKTSESIPMRSKKSLFKERSQSSRLAPLYRIYDRLLAELQAPLVDGNPSKRIDQLYDNVLVALSFECTTYEDRVKQLLIIYICYALADQLIRQLPHCKLDGKTERFYAPFWPDIYEEEPDPTYSSTAPMFQYIMEGEANIAYATLRDYFHKQKAAGGYPLFHPCRQINMRASLNAMRQSSFAPKTDAVGHLRYLSLFCDSTPSSLKTDQAIEALWKKAPEHLPQEVDQFRWIATAAYLAAYSRAAPSQIDDWAYPADTMNNNHRHPMKIYLPGYATPHPWQKQQLAMPESENSAVLPVAHRTFEEVQDSSIARLYRRLRPHPSLRIAAITDWLAAHNTLLVTDQWFWELLHEVYFQPGLLAETIGENPDLANTIRQVFYALLTTYADVKGEQEIFYNIFKMIVGIESQLKFVQKEHWSEEPLRCSLSKIAPFSGKTAVTHKAVAYSLLETMNEEEAVEFLYALFEYRSRLDLYYDVRDLLYGYYRGQAALCRLFNSKALSPAIFTPLLHKMGYEHGKKPWEGEYPLFQSGEIKINIKMGTIEIAGKDREEELAVFSRALAQFPELANAKRPFHCVDGKFWYSHDNTIRITDSDNTIYLTQLMQTAYGQLWYSRKPTCRYGIPFRSHPWRYHEPFYNPHTYILDENSGNFLWHIDHSNGEICKCDSAGRPLPIKLVDIDSSFYSHAEGGLLFYHTEEGYIESFELPELGLSFHHHKSGKLICRQYPGFFLDSDQKIEGYPLKAIVIRNTRGERRLILSADSDEQTTNKGADTSSPNHYSFSYDPLRQQLSSPSHKASLFLAKALVNAEEYEKALIQLRQARTFNKSSDYILGFDWISKQRDLSSGAVAFYLHFVIEGFLNLEQSVLDVHYLSTQIKVDWLLKIYHAYLRMLHSQEINKIPQVLRLSIEQEKWILRTLRMNITKKEQWTPLLVGRSKLLGQGKIKTDVPAAFYEVSSFNLESLRSSSKGKERALIHALKKPETLQVYRTAVEADPAKPAPVDYEILKMGRSDLTTANLLRLIRRYPAPFRNLLMTDEGRILEELEKLTTASSSFVSSFFNALVGIPEQLLVASGSQNTVALDNPPRFTPIKWQATARCKNELEALLKAPLRQFAKWFIRKKKNSPESNVFIETFKPKDEIERHIFDPIVQGQKINATAAEYDYSFKSAGLAEALEAHIKENDAAIAALKDRIETAANSTPDQKYPSLTAVLLAESASFRNRQRSKQQAKITLEGSLFDAVLMKDPTIIRSANPTLSEQEILHLMEESLRFYALTLVNKLARQCLHEVGAGNAKNAGELCEWSGDFDPLAHPELLLIAYSSGLVPRQEQLALLKWIFAKWGKSDCSHLLFAFRAGGGKSSLIIPYLVAVSIREGHLPVIITSQPLYGIDRCRLKESIYQRSKRRLHVIEASIHKPLKESESLSILKNMILMENRLEPVMMTSETLYALHLNYQLALECKNSTVVHHLSRVLRILENNGAALIDECKINLSPLMQAKISMGIAEALPTAYGRLILSIYIFLLGIKPLALDDGRQVSDVLTIQGDKQALTSAKDLELVRNRLAQQMVQAAELAIPEAQRNILLDYCLRKDKPRPEWLVALREKDPEKASLIALLRGYLTRIYPTAMQMRGGMDHGLEDGGTIFYDIHWRNKKSTHAHFEAVFLTYTLSIHGTFQRGLDGTQARAFIQFLKKKMASELPQYKGEENATPTGKLFKHWMDDKGSFTPLSAVNIEDEESIEAIGRKLSGNSEALLCFLELIVFPQVKCSPDQLEITPSHLSNTCKRRNVLFSAYPGLSSTYSLGKPESKRERAREDLTFLAKVVETAQKPENSTFLPLASNDLQEIFAQAHKSLPNLCAILDPTGITRGHSNGQVATALLNSYPSCDGILFFADEEVEKYMLLKRGEKSPTPLIGSNLIEALLKEGVKWSKANLISFYDPNHTTGADIPQKKGKQALVLIGEGLTLGDLIQTAMRMRGFIAGEQTIAWGLLQSLGLKENQAEILTWALRNEAKEVKDAVQLHAFGEIRYSIQKNPLDIIKGESNDSEKQIALLHKYYRKCLTRKVSQDPYELFGDSITLDTAGNVLRSYAENCKKMMGIKTDAQTDEAIRQVIKEVEALVPFMPSTPDGDIARQSHQFQQQHQETNEVLQKNTIENSSLTPDERESAIPLSLQIPSLVARMEKRATRARDLFASTLFLPTLYLTKQAQHTALTGDRPLGLAYRKEICFLLIVETKEGRHAFALSNEEASLVQKKLQVKAAGQVSHQLLLVTTGGFIAQKAVGAQSFSDQELINLKESDWFKDICSQAALINGNVLQIGRLTKMIKGSSDFYNCWLKIKEGLLNPLETDSQLIEELVEKYNGSKRKTESKKEMSNSWVNMLFWWN